MTQLPPVIAALLDAAAQKHNVPAGLARAVAWIESRGDAHAKSPKGALGVMQLMPATAHGLGVADPLDAAQNIDGGVRYLAQLIRQFGSVTTALAAYNWGPGYVSKHDTWPAVVIDYVRNVIDRAALEGFRPSVSPLVQQAQRRLRLQRQPGSSRGPSSDGNDGGNNAT